MLKRAFAVAALGTAAALPVAAFAQPAGTAPPVSADANSESGASYRATDLLNQQIKGEDGQVLADIEDFVLDSQTNQVQYLVLSYGGAPEGQFVIVPFSTVNVRYQGDAILVQSPLTVDVIKAAPTFAATQWVNVIRQPNWYSQVNTYWTNAGFTVGAGPGGVGIGGRGVGAGVGGRGPRGTNAPGAGNLNDRPGANPNRPGANGDRPGAGANPDRPGAGSAPGRPGAGSNAGGAGSDRPGVGDTPREDNADGVGNGPRPGAGSAPGAGASPRTPGGPGPQNPGAGSAPGAGNAPGAPPSAPGAGAGGSAGAGAGAGGAGAGAGASGGAGAGGGGAGS